MHELSQTFRALNDRIGTSRSRPRRSASKVGRWVLTALSSKAVTREIDLINEIDPQVTATADPVRLEQMLTNLVDNAIKFNRHAGSVTIAAVESQEKTSVSVTDTGEGILAGHLSRVFERFYRADRGRTREVGGTGLGLAIVKHLAELHGGSAAVESEGLGKGSKFSIHLPVGTAVTNRGSASGPATGSNHAQSTRLAGIRVLVVDDDVDTCTMLTFAIETNSAANMCCAPPLPDEA